MPAEPQSGRTTRAPAHQPANPGRGGDAAIVLADWGTSNLRAWAVDGAGGVCASWRSSQGMARLAPNAFAPAFERCLAEMRTPEDTPALICGMAGAAQGWIEAPYVFIPGGFDELAANAVAVPGQGRDIRILPGMAQRDDGAPDVMRGEETILHGLVCLGMRDAMSCLPGTHAKWARIENGGLAAFRTMMTGELFELIATQSILRHNIDVDDWSDEVFAEAVALAHARPASALEHLFALRAGPLVHGEDKARGAASRLSGLLIGAEIATGLEGHDGPLCLVASSGLASRYETALAGLGIAFQTFDAEDAVMTGLRHLASRIWPGRMTTGAAP